MSKDKKIMDIVRQEKLLEKQIAALEAKRRSLAKNKQSLFDRRWVLAVRKLVGKTVEIAGHFMGTDFADLNDQSGVLKSVGRDGTCQVDFAQLGLRQLIARDLLASDHEEWRRLIDGE